MRDLTTEILMVARSRGLMAIEKVLGETIAVNTPYFFKSHGSSYFMCRFQNSKGVILKSLSTKSLPEDEFISKNHSEFYHSTIRTLMEMHLRWDVPELTFIIFDSDEELDRYRTILELNFQT